MNVRRPVALYYSILKYQPENRKRLDVLFEVIELPDPSLDTAEILSRAEVIFAPLGYQVDQAKIDAAPLLKVIASNTTGHPHIDVAYARSKGLQVACLKYAQEFLSTITPTAELTWGLIIALTRNLFQAHSAALQGGWDRRPFGAPAMLSRLSLGIVGLGRLGSLVARYGLAFGMTVRYYDPYVDSQEEGLNRLASLKELVAASDIVTIHIPHEPETENLFDQAILSCFKKGSYLINTARGELIDWGAFLQAMQDGRLAGAALDVFEGEFVPGFQDRFPSHPVLDYARTHHNLILTPHIGGSTIDAWRLTEGHTIDMIESFLRTDQEEQHG